MNKIIIKDIKQVLKEYDIILSKDFYGKIDVEFKEKYKKH
jgi:hypothetical protein